MSRLDEHVILLEDVFANIPDLTDPLLLSLYPVGALYSATDVSIIYRRDEDETWHVWATLGTPPTLAKLYDYEVSGSDKASIDTFVDGVTVTDFAGYDVLELWIAARTDAAGSSSQFEMTLNNDTGSNYDDQHEYANNTTVAAGVLLAQAKWLLDVHGSGGSADYPSIVRLTLPNYAGTVFNKVAEAVSAEVDATAGNNEAQIYAFGYRSTSAITRVKIAGAGADKFKVGTRLIVYGR